MKKLDDDLEEIDRFLKSWQVISPVETSAPLKAKIKASYKQFHSLLVWGLAVETGVPDGKLIKTYFTEALSDLSHAYFLNLCSLYKSSRSSLRSAIENMVRVLLLHKNVDISKMNSVFELFGQVKTAYKGDAIALALIDKLQMHYAELCKSVHSAKIDYLSLRIPFENLSAFDAVTFSAINETLRSVSSTLNQSVFWIWDHMLSKCGPRNEDMVRDALPTSIKRAKAA